MITVKVLNATIFSNMVYYGMVYVVPNSLIYISNGQPENVFRKMLIIYGISGLSYIAFAFIQEIPQLGRKYTLVLGFTGATIGYFSVLCDGYFHSHDWNILVQRF